MAYVAHPHEFQGTVAPGRQAAAVKATPRGGVLRRFFATILDARERKVRRDVEAYLARTGYRFTDSIEREISNRLIFDGWNARRN
jgi:hypothetical protein